MQSYCLDCADNGGEGVNYFATASQIPEPIGRTRNRFIGDGDALLLPGRSYRIPIAATGDPVAYEPGMIAIPTQGEDARVYVHKAELNGDGLGVAVVTSLDAPVLATSVVAGALPGIQTASFTDVVEFIGDFSFGWLAIGVLIGIGVIWSIR